VSTPAPAIAEPVIRVGLLVDQPSAVFPRTADGYLLVTDKGASTLGRGFTAQAPLAGAAVRYAVQMAAISDESSAIGVVDKVAAETALPIDKTFDPASGMFKILAGDFASAEEAAPIRSRLIESGYGKDLLVVRRPAKQAFDKRIVIVDDEGDQTTIDGAVLRVFPISAPSITLDKQPYRTSARLFVNPRGLLNVINELNLEEYLYGVVPAEMGPSIYDELEALKAQAVAARTYALRNLGQFESEGYDICPGPACQAYKGFAGEHELSTRAVRETAGLVMTYDGKLIDALYSATCGGETSDVATMFPGRSEPYLARVRCVELEILPLAGRAGSPPLTEQQASARIFAAVAGLRETSSWAARDVAEAVGAAQRVAGFEASTRIAPASSRRGDVLAYLASALALESKSRVLTLPEDRKYFFPNSANPDDRAHAAAAFLIKFGILPAQAIDRAALDQAMPREELHALLGAWLREHSLLRDVEGRIFSLDGRKVTLKQKGETFAHTLPPGIPIFRRVSDRLQEYAEVPVMIGDRATLVAGAGGTIVAAIVQANYDGAALDRTSSFSNWTRSYRADELVQSISRRNPIQQLEDLRPVTIDASQRVAELEVTAENGRTFVLRGLPVRWSLGVPDNLFVFDKTKDPDGMDRYTFFGKGWGHGTGMCQVGAFGAAFRGWSFDRILRHYYTGVEIVRR
jgi:stage II sporulation protein D